MALISVEFDTVQKTMVVKKNGEVVEDVNSVEFWKSYDDDEKFRVGLTMVKENEEDKMHEITRVYANECPEGKEEEQLTPLQRSVAEYISG